PPEQPDTPNRNTLTAEDLALEAPEAQEPQNHGFSRMQGRLQRPASGSISGRFGQARPGGGTWKGLFISTPPTAVRSIAEGEVAYAAPLQGYGNTVIVDHGSGYLSIYTGLSQISAGAGSRVSARQTIGRSGSLPDGENGLYFEIRYRNQAMNPASWVN
uniref:murein hydrolase activator EnvC family protein n=2 Tax=Neisseriaceae TaxID=481 RepID=UPI00129A5547